MEETITGQKGKVKWFNNKKGFGFIIFENSQDEVFVHYSVIEKQGFKTLKENNEVIFDAVKTQKGYKATKVIPPPKKQSEQQSPQQK
ncbi:MAG: cold shock domain-containing protein [Elusimicrobiales bacterium]|nr:cold shock domain-containing protein [Elusimicrobiales bacterium]